MLIRALVVAIMLALIAPAFAQQSLRDWFNSLKSPGGGICCRDFDGLSLEEDTWRTSGDHYQVLVKGQWIDVPESSVVNEPNRLGRAHVWLRYDGSVRCFLPGTLS
jgi:hypothetical protein